MASNPVHESEAVAQPPPAAATLVKSDSLWGKLKEPAAVPMESTATKMDIRQSVWQFLERNDIANFPRPVYNRIPNFKGAAAAGQRLAELDEFASAKSVEVSPDKPQEEVRYQVLSRGKSLVVPTPRLSGGLFNRVSCVPGCGQDEMRKLASRRGIDSESKPIPVAARFKIDLVVVGSVAVDRLGRRLGKGEGFVDLEWALAASHHGGAVNENTVVVTTVHDCQVVDELPEELFGSHDLPCDVIVTPTQVIRVAERLKKPERIIWSLITREKFEQIDILKEIQFKEKRAGKDVRLKGEPEDGIDDRMGKENGEVGGEQRRRKQRERKKKVKEDKDATDKKEDAANAKNNPVRENGDGEASEAKEAAANKVAKKHPKPSRSVFIGRIPRNSRFKDLKEALAEKGFVLNPKAGCSLVWKGHYKGFAFLNLGVKQYPDLDEVAQKLSGLTLHDVELNVQTDQKKGRRKSNNASDEADDDIKAVDGSTEGKQPSGDRKGSNKQRYYNSRTFSQIDS